MNKFIIGQLRTVLNRRAQGDTDVTIFMCHSIRQIAGDDARDALQAHILNGFGDDAYDQDNPSEKRMIASLDDIVQRCPKRLPSLAWTPVWRVALSRSGGPAPCLPGRAGKACALTT